MIEPAYRDWTVAAKCPHGETVDLEFTVFGYLMKPPSCRHPDIAPRHRRVGRIKVYFEMRRFRRMLKHGVPRWSK